jgi:hypothetical protein
MPETDTAEDLVRTVIKLVVATIGLLLVRAMLALLPGGDRPIPGTPIELETVLVAIFMFLIAGVVIYYGRQLSATVASSGYVTPDLREAGSRMILGLSLFIALLTVYDGLSSIAVGFLIDDPATRFVFDAVFLLAGLLVLLWLGHTVLRNLDPFIDAVTDVVTRGETGVDSADATDGGGQSGTITCPNCGSDYQQGTAFCADCGTALAGGSN